MKDMIFNAARHIQKVIKWWWIHHHSQVQLQREEKVCSITV